MFYLGKKLINNTPKLQICNKEIIGLNQLQNIWQKSHRLEIDNNSFNNITKDDSNVSICNSSCEEKLVEEEAEQ